MRATPQRFSETEQNDRIVTTFSSARASETVSLQFSSREFLSLRVVKCDVLRQLRGAAHCDN